MTDTLMGVSPPPEPAPAGEAEDPPLSPAELAAVEDLVRQARQAGVALTGPAGLLKAMTKTVIEAALEEEIADHLGYDKHAVEGRNRANSRNGKTLEDRLDRQLRRGRHRRPT
jgi:putative transposase